MDSSVALRDDLPNFLIDILDFLVANSTVLLALLALLSVLWGVFYLRNRRRRPKPARASGSPADLPIRPQQTSPEQPQPSLDAALQRILELEQTVQAFSAKAEVEAAMPADPPAPAPEPPASVMPTPPAPTESLPGTYLELVILRRCLQELTNQFENLSPDEERTLRENLSLEELIEQVTDWLVLPDDQPEKWTALVESNWVLHWRRLEARLAMTGGEAAGPNWSLLQNRVVLINALLRRLAAWAAGSIVAYGAPLVTPAELRGQFPDVAARHAVRFLSHLPHSRARLTALSSVLSGRHDFAICLDQEQFAAWTRPDWDLSTRATPVPPPSNLVAQTMGRS